MKNFYRICGAVFLTMILQFCEKDDEYYVNDKDGNSYAVVIIGDQVWMKENLKTTRYNNGDLIGTTSPATMDISYADNPGYQWAYNGDETNVAAYGRLYTWYAATDSRNVCPEGWHVPTDEEWTILTDYLTENGYGYEGSGPDIAKSLAAGSGWIENIAAGTVGYNEKSNDSTGFKALPGGYRFAAGTFTNTGFYGIWWSSTEYDSDYAWTRIITSYSGLVNRSNYSNKSYGLSVRCLKDQ